MNDTNITEAQLDELQARLDAADSVPIKCQMNHFGFEFIVQQMKIQFQI